jgi:hypothetical protein
MHHPGTDTVDVAAVATTDATNVATVFVQL